MPGNSKTVPFLSITASCPLLFDQKWSHSKGIQPKLGTRFVYIFCHCQRFRDLRRTNYVSLCAYLDVRANRVSIKHERGLWERVGVPSDRFINIYFCRDIFLYSFSFFLYCYYIILINDDSLLRKSQKINFMIYLIILFLQFLLYSFIYFLFIYSFIYIFMDWLNYLFINFFFLQILFFNVHVYRSFMSHKYTLIEILLVSNMNQLDSYFNNSRCVCVWGGGGGPESSPATLDPWTWSIQQGLSRLIFKILILPISHIEDAMLNSTSASSYNTGSQKASVIIDSRSTITYCHLADCSRIFLWHICNFVYFNYALWPF